MTKTEQNRVLAWRLKLQHEASVMPRNVAQACRHFGLSRKTFYKWKARYKAYGEAGLCDRPRVPLHSPRATPREVVSKILYLRQRYHFGPGRIAHYLQRFHHLTVVRSSVHRILIRHGMNRLPANQKRKPTGQAWKRYEKPQPGHRLQWDVKFLERIAGTRKRLYQFTAERRNQRTHPIYTKPQLLAIRPNEVCSWDITKLKGPAKWTCFHLYVILDIYSRYVVGWLIAHRESAELAEQLIADTLQKENIAPGTLTLHADRGTSMRSKPVAALLIDLDVAKTHSRPHVSDDNPYSEAQFKTLQYRPDFPDRFGSIEDARAHCQQFFRWYNHEHRHGGIGLMAPAAVHDGTAAAMTAQRAVTLDSAFVAHPLRFKGIAPKPPALPTAIWINPPKKESTPLSITPACSLIS